MSRRGSVVRFYERLEIKIRFERSVKLEVVKCFTSSSRFLRYRSQWSAEDVAKQNDCKGQVEELSRDIHVVHKTGKPRERRRAAFCFCSCSCSCKMQKLMQRLGLRRVEYIVVGTS